MGHYKRSPQQEKILLGMGKVYEKLIEFKRNIKGEIVLLKDQQIIRIKP